MMEANSNKPAPRIPLKIDVEFRRNYSRSNETGTLRNISQSGAFLQNESHGLQADDKLNITFNVAGRMRKITALVIWTNDRGCGVKFMPTNGQDVQIVDDFMECVQDARSTKRSLLNDIFKRVA